MNVDLVELNRDASSGLGNFIQHVNSFSVKHPFGKMLLQDGKFIARYHELLEKAILTNYNTLE